MARYAIGDLQGCCDVFQRLLAHIGFNPGRDTLWLTGDLVNRGPQSLETLRYVMQHETCMQTVLGNHDLHLLAVAYGGARLKRSDTLDDILNATDNKFLLEWLRAQPLMLADGKHALVHAGLWPQWSIEEALDLAEEVEEAVGGLHPQAFFMQMYGNKPRRFSHELRGIERLRFTTNVMTRMRALTDSGDLDFDYKGTYEALPPHLYAWFDVAHADWHGHQVVFGHWSALGYRAAPHYLSLDTGAVWGGALTAVDLDSGEVFQVPGMAEGQALLAAHG